jgi:hypothetical protein
MQTCFESLLFKNLTVYAALITHTWLSIKDGIVQQAAENVTLGTVVPSRPFETYPPRPPATPPAEGISQGVDFLRLPLFQSS